MAFLVADLAFVAAALDTCMGEYSDGRTHDRAYLSFLGRCFGARRGDDLEEGVKATLRGFLTTRQHLFDTRLDAILTVAPMESRWFVSDIGRVQERGFVRRGVPKAFFFDHELNQGVFLRRFPFKLSVTMTGTR